nr:hypothetical protein [Comamonas jiangduensis]
MAQRQIVQVFPALHGVGMGQHQAIATNQHVLHIRQRCCGIRHQRRQGQLHDGCQGTGHLPILTPHGHAQQYPQMLAVVQHWYMRNKGLALGDRAPQSIQSLRVNLCHGPHGTMVRQPPCGQCHMQTVKNPQHGAVLLHQGIQHCGVVQQAGVHTLCNCGEQPLVRFHARSEHARPQVGILGLMRCQALLRAGIQHPHQAQSAQQHGSQYQHHLRNQGHAKASPAGCRSHWQ